MAWEEFKEKRKGMKEPAIRITKSGQLILNRACYIKYFKDYKFVSLHYEPETGMVGIKAHAKNLPHHFTLSVREGGRDCSIGARSFLRNYKIPYDTIRSFPVEWDDELKIVKFKVSETLEGKIE